MGQAREWLFSFVKMENYKPEDLTWTRFKLLFRREFAVQSDDKLIIDRLSNLAKKLEKTTRKFLTSVT
jgi:hypothetical protein